MKVAVVGANGRIGAVVVDVLGRRGHDVVPIARSAGVDVYTGEGLAAALAGVEVVVDAVNVSSQDTDVVVDFFGTSARNLQREGAAAGVRRIVLVSIIGIDPFTSGHYAGKLAQERALAEGRVPVRVVRAAQFHEFPGMVLEWTTEGDVARVPEVRAQLVSSRAVAEKVVEAVLVEDVPALVDIAGPEEFRLVDAVRLLVERRGAAMRVEEVPAGDDPDQARLAAGALLPGPDAVIAGESFGEWLDERYPAG
ncbi:NAD(P)H-binding protein [Actinosynnema sp. NPDC047251]|uniref:SDR family oxidoreductase n=1 Tax=Saccharothrix espanaensis TaxID=103731 RepID=UPI00031D81E0|nr:NAD(P)H-binding protein [Saccharothrix espanaensis]